MVGDKLFPVFKKKLKVHEAIKNERVLIGNKVKYFLSTFSNNKSIHFYNGKVKELIKSRFILDQLKAIEILIKLNKTEYAESVCRLLLSQRYIDRIMDYSVYISEPKVYDRIVQILSLISTNLNEKVFTDVMSFIYFDTNGKLYFEIGKKFNPPNRLKLVQDYASSNNFGLKYPNIWAAYIYKFSSSKDLKNYLEKVNIWKRLEKDPLEFSSLNGYLPKMKQRRNIILSILNKTDSKYILSVAFDFLQKSEWQNFVQNNKIKKLYPYAVKKRRFYLDSYERGEAILLSMFKLVELNSFFDDFYDTGLWLKTNEI